MSKTIFSENWIDFKKINLNISELKIGKLSNKEKYIKYKQKNKIQVPKFLQQDQRKHLNNEFKM